MNDVHDGQPKNERPAAGDLNNWDRRCINSHTGSSEERHSLPNSFSAEGSGSAEVDELFTLSRSLGPKSKQYAVKFMKTSRT